MMVLFCPSLEFIELKNGNAPLFGKGIPTPSNSLSHHLKAANFTQILT